MKAIILILPIIIGFFLDLIFGDPYDLPHPIRLIGVLIAKLELVLRKHMHNHERAAGTILAITVLLLSLLVPAAILFVCYRVNLILGISAESIMCYYLLAAKCLKTESMKVYSAIAENDIEKARLAVLFTRRRTQWIPCSATKMKDTSISDGLPRNLTIY